MKILKKPRFAVVLLVIAVVCLVVGIVLPTWNYKQEEGKVIFENPDSYTSSKDGWKLVVDDGNRIYCAKENEEFVYGIGIEDFPYDNAKIIDVTFGEDNNAYCHIAVYDDKAYLTDEEVVWEINSEGELVREVFHYDYNKSDNPPSHQVRVSGLYYEDGKLCYIYKEEDGCNVVQVNPDNTQEVEKASVSYKGHGKIMKCYKAEDGFIVLKNNGEMGTISLDGKYKSLYEAEYDIRKKEGLLPFDVYMVGKDIYMLSNQDTLKLYKWNDDAKDKWELVLDVEEEAGIEKEVDLYSFGLGQFDDKLTINVNESLYVLEEGTIAKAMAECELPTGVATAMMLKEVLVIVGAILLFIGVILGIGNLMKWRFSLLSKQLFSTIPVVCVMLAVVIIIMFSSMIDLSSEDIIQEATAVAEIAAAQFDGDELEKIVSLDSVNDGTVDELNEKLRKFVNGNTSSWSRNYNLAIYVRTEGEEFTCIASSDESYQFMVSDFSTEMPINEAYYEESNTFVADVGYGDGRENLHLVLITPIYSEDGNYNAVMLLNASQDRLTEKLIAAGQSLLINILFWGVVLVVVISLVAARNVKALRRAKDVVAQIAGGDFSVRVEKYTKDEVGEICVGVNDMAGKLEDLFEERKRNELFYYKFVPKKFKELLHKKEFTDLALGDAQSMELSILFCDIRAFSMNSEMMTAKESFDFVNRIYGVAGPIVRKHNGFIDKYIGDAVMALFESAQDAVNAGIELYKAITLNPDPEKEFGLPSVKVGVGIHSGMARIGIVGEEERMSGTVIADTVNLSSRIESLTKRYGAGMIISKDTLDRMDNPDVLSARYLGLVQVAGVNEVVTLYEVMDCLEDGQRTKKEESKIEFREALRMYHSGELEEALEAFRKITESNEDDKASRLYAEYIENKIASGDTENNIFKFVNK